MKNKVVLLSSGGLDSTTLAYWLLDRNIDFIPLIINYGQLFFNTELETLKKVLPNNIKNTIKIIDISQVYNGSDSRLIKQTDLWNERISADDLYLPYRNIVILSIAAAYASTTGAKAVYAGFINSNHAKEIDCSSKFFEKLDSVLNDSGSVDIKMPFRYKSKYEVARIGISLKAPIGITFSCQVSKMIPCGACPNCVDRINAFKKIRNNE